MTPEQLEARRARNNAWNKANRPRMNRLKRERKAMEREALMAQGFPVNSSWDHLEHILRLYAINTQEQDGN